MMIGGGTEACKAPAPGWLARRADVLLAAGILFGGLALCGARAAGRAAELAAAGPPPETASVAHRVDLWSASETELRLLPGVGPRLAERIAAERGAHGPFASLEDVGRRVPGVGPVRLGRWRGLVVEPRGGSR